MKKRGLSLLLVVTFLLSLFMFCTTAFAASNEQNGLSAELITDKQEYTAGEEVGITLKVKNTSAYVSNIWAKLVLPSVLRLKQGELDSGVFELPVNDEEEFTYTADTPAPSTTTTVPTTTVPTTTVAGTTVTPGTGSGTSGGPSDTGDVSLYIFGALAAFSLIGLVVVLGGFKGLMKNRWFVLVLCVALLLPLVAPLAASAVVTEKFFEVTVNVKVDGEPNEIKAVITYDFDDGIYPASEVEFKAEGESLYKLVGEEGWYTPCNKTIIIDGIKASHSVRPEVTASYIDMLFGCVSNKTNTFVPGILDNAQILSEDAQKELLVGLTEDKASMKALDLIDKDEWIIAEIDGKIVVTGWFDNATVAAVQHLYSLVDGQDDVTLQLPIKGSVDGFVTDIPDVETGVFSGGMDGSEGTLVLRYSVEDATAFKAYAEALEDAGYALYSDHEIAAYGGEKHLFATYTKGDSAVHISYLTDSFMEADYDSLTANEKATYDRSFRPLGKELRIVTDTKANLYTNGETNDYDDLGIQPKISIVNLWDQAADGNDNGECIIFTLADGSFIVADSGFAQDADHIFKTLAELNERPDGKIVIAAWIMSHHHIDHIGGFKAMAEMDYAEDIIVEQFIFNPTASTYHWRSKNAPYNYASDLDHSIYNHDYIAEFLDKFGGDTQIVNPHMGVNMKIRNAEIEFLYTGDEDLYPVHIDNTNDTSMVYTVNFKGQSGEADSRILMINDACCDSMNHVLQPLFNQVLDCDIVQVGHHGFGGPSSSLYRMMEPTVAIWCTTEETTKKLNHFPTDGSAFGGSAGYLVYRLADDENDPVDLIIHADQYVHTLQLPFTAGDPVYKSGLGSYKSNFFEQNKVKVATMAAGQFGGDLEACLDAVAQYLLAENADILGLTDVTADQVETIAHALGYPYYGFAPIDASDANSAGNLLLSRYPMTDFDVVVANTRAFSAAVLDVEGIAVDVALVDVENVSQLGGVTLPKQGDYQIIVGVTAVDMAQNGTVAAVSGNANENIYAMTALASGVTITDGKLENAAEKTGVEDLGKLVSGNLVLSRKHLIEDFEEGSFDNVLTVAVQYAYWRNILSEKEQLLRWIMAEKPEILGLLAAPSEVLSDEGAAEFAALAGYEHYAWIQVWQSSAKDFRGHLLLSHYPIDKASQETILLRADNGQMDSKAEGRAYFKVVVTMPGDKKVNVYVGENDPSGATWEEHKKILEDAVKANYAADGRDFIIIGYRESHVSDTYAGVAVKSYHSDGSPVAPCSIIVSGDFPMDGMRTYGTKAYPVGGRSPIGTTILNISPYAKVELTDLPEYDLVVNGGTGSGAFQKGEEVYAMAGAPGKGVVFTGWTAEGITLTDPKAVEQVFEMPDHKVTLTAHYEAVPYAERNEVGTSDELKVAILPCYRFQNKFTKYSQQIIENLKNCGADILVVSQVDYDTSCKRNGVDVVPTLREALAEQYAYSYFAPGYVAGTTSDTDPGAGHVGHLILSKHPFMSTESVELNTEPSEIRNAGHVVINMGTESEPTRLGVYFTHMGAATNWTTGKQNLYDVINGATEDAFLVLGKAHYTDAKSTIAQKLGTTVVANDANLTIFGSGNITIKDGSYGKDSTIKDLYVADAEPYSTESLYYATISMPTYEDGEIKYPITVGEEIIGWYAENEAVTLTAPAAPVGRHFNGWTLPQDLTLTEGSEDTATIKFNMPAKALVLAQNYQDWPVGTVAFNANGGKGTMASVDANAGDFTLPANGFYSPAGKKFVGWGLTATATKADAVNTVVVTGDTTTTVYAIWEDTGSVSTAVVVANRFSNKYQNAADRAKIHEKLLTLDVDILAITQISESMTNPSAYDPSAMFTEISTALKEAYPYAYFAPAWYGAENKQGGSTGHMILSKYEMVGDGKTIVLLEGVPSGMTGSVEGRSAGKVTLNIRGVATDVFFMHTGHQDQWSILAPEIKKSENWIAIGYMNYANLNEAGVEGYLEQDISAAFPYKNVAGQTWNFVNIISNSAVSNADTDTALFTGYTTYAVYKATVAQPVTSKTVTVTDGSGSGEYKPGTTVTLDANDAPSGKVFSYWDGLQGLTLTEGNAVSSTLKFTMPKSDVTVKAVYRNEGEIKTAQITVNRFGDKYKNDTDRAAIHNELLALDVDILALTQIGEGMNNPSNYDSSKMATGVAEALKYEYPYSYYVPAWYASDAADSGSTGHMILSKFPFTAREKFVIVSGTPYGTAGGYTEGRSAGKVTMSIDGSTVDVFFTHLNAFGNWDVLAPIVKASTADCWFVMGNVKNNDLATIGNKLGQSVTRINEYGEFKSFASGNVTCTAANSYPAFTYGSGKILKNPVKLPEAKTVTVTDGVGGGEYIPGNTVTLTANAAPSGKVFSYWDGLQGLTLTEGNAATGTIKFTMPSSDVTVKAVYRNVGEIKIGSIPTTKFTNKFTKNKALLTTYLQGLDLDVVAFSGVDENCKNASGGNIWNGTNVMSQLIDIMKDEYPYYYVVKAWYAYQDPSTMVEGSLNGWIGHVIFSKLPFESEQTIIQYDDATGEDRGAGRVTINVDGVALDVYVMNNGGASHWNSAATGYTSVAATINSRNNPWIALGNLHIDNESKFNTVNGYLTDGMTSADVNSGWTEYITGSKNLTWTNKSDFTKAEQAEYGIDIYLSASYPQNSYDWQFATVKLPEKKTVTVTDGSGSGDHAVGTTVTLTANAAPSGKVFSYWDGLQGLTLTEGNAVSSTLKFTMPGSDVTVKAVYRNKGEVKTAQITVNRFGDKYKNETDRASIHADLLALDVDILALTQIGEGMNNPSRYDSSKMATGVAEALKHEYPYSYYAPAWFASTAADSGSSGHMILSKFPITEQETAVVVAGTPYATSGYTEGRSAARIKINIDGITVDVFATHLNDFGNWDVLAPIVNASTADCWFVMGNVKNNDLATIGNKLGRTVTRIAEYGEFKTFASGNVTCTANNSYANFSYGGGKLLRNAVKLPEKKTVTVTDGSGSGDHAVGATVTLTANAAPAGKVFSYWEGLGGLTLTQGNAVSSTLKFTMPGSDVTVKAVYRNVGEIKVASIPTNQFKNGYKTHASAIHAELLSRDVDIMAITLVDENCKDRSGNLIWNKSNVATQLIDALEHEYPYYYAAKVWCAYSEDNTESLDRWVVHLLFSKFPFDSTQTVKQYDGVVSESAVNGSEDRGAAYATVTVDGIKLDVIAMNNDGPGRWDTKVSGGKSIVELINASTSDAWIAMGNLQTNSESRFNQVKDYLTKGAAPADVDPNGWEEYIVGSTNLSYSNKAMISAATLQNSGWNQYAWQFATVTLPEK